MSANNGVFILKTKNNEFRVVYDVCDVQEIFESYESFIKNKDAMSMNDVMYDFWGRSKVHNSIEDALEEADVIADDIGYLEYGISIIDGMKYDFPEGYDDGEK